MGEGPAILNRGRELKKLKIAGHLAAVNQVTDFIAESKIELV